MSEAQNNPFISFIDFNKNHPLAEHLQPAYYQLGFICSVQAVPEIIDLEKWLVCLWRNDVISFDNEKQATEYAQVVLTMLTEIDHLYEQAKPLEQLNCMNWLGEQHLLSENALLFASGFLAAIEIFNAEWSGRFLKNFDNSEDQSLTMIRQYIIILSNKNYNNIVISITFKQFY